jgi:hypothetical protein
MSDDLEGEERTDRSSQGWIMKAMRIEAMSDG